MAKFRKVRVGWWTIAARDFEEAFKSNSKEVHIDCVWEDTYKGIRTWKVYVREDGIQRDSSRDWNFDFNTFWSLKDAKKFAIALYDWYQKMDAGEEVVAPKFKDFDNR